MKKTIFILCLLIHSLSWAQKDKPIDTNVNTKPSVTCVPIPTPGDLVANGDFEQFSTLPNNATQIEKACGWFSATSKTPDYFHRDGTGLALLPDTYIGFKEVNPTPGGDAFVGITHTLNNKEMIRTQLSEPLLSDTEYILQFDVSAADYKGYIGFLKFQAYLGGLILGTVNSGDLDIGSDPGGILLEDDVFTTNTHDWNTITFTFTTGNTADQEYLYIGGISDYELMTNTHGYSFIDNVSLKPVNAPPLCGTCSDTPGEFPVVSNTSFFDYDAIIGKTVTSDCSGNIYSVGNWGNAVMLRKYDLNGILVWSQNINISENDLNANIILEVDNNESVYLKYNKRLRKYDSSGAVVWNILINNNTFAPNKNSLALNKETGDLYFPINRNTTLTSSGNTDSFTVLSNQGNVLKIDTNANVSDLGIFTSSNILNVHYNNGLKLWSRSASGIEYRQYSPNTDILTITNTTWVDNSLLANYDSFIPLFYNHVKDEIYVYARELIGTTYPNNPHILSINSQGIINADITLIGPGIYHGNHALSAQAPFSFNTNSGDLAIYADGLQNGGRSFVSTINFNYELEIQYLTPEPLIPPPGINPFYTRSFHAITYSGDCLYFYGSYESVNPVFLTGGITLPPSGNSNNHRSVILRMQNDLTISKSVSEKSDTQNHIKFYPVPFKNNLNLKDKLNRGISKVEVYNVYGKLIHSQIYSPNQPITVSKGKSGLYFAKVHFNNGTVETIQLLRE